MKKYYFHDKIVWCTTAIYVLQFVTNTEVLYYEYTAATRIIY